MALLQEASHCLCGQPPRRFSWTLSWQEQQPSQHSQQHGKEAVLRSLRNVLNAGRPEYRSSDRLKEKDQRKLGVDVSLPVVENDLCKEKNQHNWSFFFCVPGHARSSVR